LDCAKYVVAELAKIGVRANAMVLSSERPQRFGRNAADVEIEMVRSPLPLNTALWCYG
jgi:hypothetical protein